MAYNTKKEAETAKKKILDDFEKTTFCPMITGNCRRDCICFNDPVVEHIKNINSYVVGVATCGNHQYTG